MSSWTPLSKRASSPGLSIFAKASNLLDSPIVRFINPNSLTASLKGYPTWRGAVIERKEWHAQTVTVGLRFRPS